MQAQDILRLITSLKDFQKEQASMGVGSVSEKKAKLFGSFSIGIQQFQFDFAVKYLAAELTIN